MMTSARQIWHNKALDAEPPIASFLKSMLIGGGPVNAIVIRLEQFDVPLNHDWPLTLKHFDPGWNDHILDQFDLCVESDAKNILDVLPQISGSELGFSDGASLSIEIHDLLKFDKFPLEDRILLWQPRGHRWTQIDSTLLPLGSGLANELSTILKCAAYESCCTQSVWAHHWRVWRNGEIVYDYEASEFGIDELTPIEKRKIRAPETVYSPDHWVAFFTTDRSLKTTDPKIDALKLREHMQNAFDFFVGCYSLYEDVSYVWEHYSKENFAAAFAIDIRKLHG